MLALLAIIAGSVITGCSAYKIHALRRGRGRKLRDMEVLRRLDMPPKKQVRFWSALLVLGLVLLTPGLGYLLAVEPISITGGDAPYSNLRATPSGTPATAPLSEKLDKTPRTVEKEGSGSSGFFSSSGGGASSKRSSSGGGGGSSGSSTKEENTSVIEIPPAGRDYSAGESSNPISYAHETNETSDVKADESGSTDQKVDEPSETKANDTKLDEGESEGEPTTLKDRTPTSAKIEPSIAEASTETAIIGVSREKSTVPAFSGYSKEVIVSEEIAPKEILSEEVAPEKIGRGSDQAEAPASPVVVEAASEKRTVPQTPEYPIEETVPEPTSEEESSESAAPEIDLDESPSPDAVASSDEFKSPSPAPSSKPLGSEPESETKTAPAAPEASEGDLSRIKSTVEDPAKSESSEIPSAQTEAPAEEVKKLVFDEGSTQDTNGTANISAEKSGEGETALPNLDGLFGDFNATSGSYVFGGDSDFMSRFQDFTSNAQTGTGTAKNGTLNPVSLLEFEPIDLRSNFQSESGLTPTTPFI